MVELAVKEQLAEVCFILLHVSQETVRGQAWRHAALPIAHLNGHHFISLTLTFKI